MVNKAQSVGGKAALDKWRFQFKSTIGLLFIILENNTESTNYYLFNEYYVLALDIMYDNIILFFYL